MRQITVKMGLHVCTQCAAVDLCDRCMTNYAATALAPATCSGHTFFDVDATSLGSVGSTALQGQVAFAAWMDEISNQYK